MGNDRAWGPLSSSECDFTGEELAAFREFGEASLRGERPCIEAHLARYPHLAAKLRPLCEAAEWFDAEVREFRLRCPDFSIWELFGASPRTG